jgi:hypothetical protein
MEQNNIEISPFSRKRAFWACLAAGVFGFHRVYCGKLWTGYFQMILYNTAVAWLSFSGPRNMENVLHPMGTVALIAIIVWVLLDFVMIIRKDFRDKEGRRISEGLLFH